MATKQYKVTLSDEAADFLRAEDSRGRLSEGIDRLIQRVKANRPQPSEADFTSKKKAADEIPDDPRNPTNNWNVAQRLAREDAIAAAETKETHDRPRREFRDRMEHTIIHGHGQNIINEFNDEYAHLIPAEERKAIIDRLLMDLDVLAERDRATRQREESRARDRIRDSQLAAGWTQADITTDYQRRNGVTPEHPAQTERLSAKALKGMGLFGTPEALTDDQIRELNASWANRDADIMTDDDGFGAYES